MMMQKTYLLKLSNTGQQLSKQNCYSLKVITKEINQMRMRMQTQKWSRIPQSHKTGVHFKKTENFILEMTETESSEVLFSTGLLEYGRNQKDFNSSIWNTGGKFHSKTTAQIHYPSSSSPQKNNYNKSQLFNSSNSDCSISDEIYGGYQKQLYSSTKIYKQFRPVQYGAQVIGGQEFLATCTVLDSLGEQQLNFARNKLVQTTSGLAWNFTNPIETITYSPSMLVIPTTNFLFKLQLQYLSNCQKEVFNLFIDANQAQQGLFEVCANVHGMLIKIDCELIVQQPKKMKLIEQLNYKVHEQTFLSANIVRIGGLQVIFDGKAELENNQVINYKTGMGQRMFESIITQDGSKQHQKKLKLMDPSELDQIISALMDYFPSLINDEYGNYFMQSLIKYLDLTQRVTILEGIKPYLNQLICSPHGTFVFQAFVGRFEDYSQFQITTQATRLCFSEGSQGQYSSHFYRKLIQEMPEQLLSCFKDEWIKNFINLSKNKYSVCVLKSILKRLVVITFQETYTLKNLFLNQLATNLNQIITSQFGNYLIQEAQQRFTYTDLHQLNSMIASKFFTLYMNKYSSIVLIKCLKKYWVHNQYCYYTVMNQITYENIKKLNKNKEGSKVWQEIQSCQYYCENPQQYVYQQQFPNTLNSESPKKRNKNRSRKA